MSIKSVHVCDGCGRVLENTKDIYYIDLRTNDFWDGIDTDFIEEHLEFCLQCAVSIKRTLENIAQRGRYNE